MEKKKKTKILTRVISSLIGFPIIVLILIFSNNIAMDIFVTLVALISMYEYFNCFKKSNTANPSSWLGYLVAVTLSIMHIAEVSLLKSLYLVPIVLLILVIEMLFSKGKKNAMDILITAMGICYIPGMLMFLSMIRADIPNGMLLVWYVFCAAWGSDVFAYFIGCKFGKHKFTEISPNKSIEGCVAGVVGAMVTALIVSFVANRFFGAQVDYGIIVVIVALLSIAGQIGDLFASSIKRYCGVKDYGDLIPGHGGMLDRIDSIIFILPFAYILLNLIS